MLVDSEEFKRFGEQIKNLSQHNFEKGMLPDLSNINMGELQNPEKIIVDIEDSQNIYGMLVDSLSKMELEVLFYMNSGMDYHMIAKTMGRTDKNIDNAIQRIRNKARKIINASKE